MTSNENTMSGSSSGPSVDRAGTPVVDPTLNVQNIIEAAVRRLDDLRGESVLARDRAIENVKELMVVHAMYTEKLQVAEAKRIDAIRAVDVNAVAVANERAAAQATVLASQLATSAETLRALVATTATQVAQQLQQLTTQLTDRLATLEKGAYEGVGRTRVQDPMMAELLLEMKQLRTVSSTHHGSGEGMGKLAGWIFAGIAAAGVLVMMVINLSK